MITIIWNLETEFRELRSAGLSSVTALRRDLPAASDLVPVET